MAAFVVDALCFSGGHPAAASHLYRLHPGSYSRPGLPAGARSACSPWVALSCQLETGAERGRGQAQLPRQVKQLSSSPLGLLQLLVVSAPIRK